MASRAAWTISDRILGSLNQEAFAACGCSATAVIPYCAHPVCASARGLLGAVVLLSRKSRLTVQEPLRLHPQAAGPSQCAIERASRTADRPWTTVHSCPVRS